MANLNQDKWMMYEDDIIKYYYIQWKDWLTNPDRKPANIAFTSGLGRDVAWVIEEAFRLKQDEIFKKIESIELLERLSELEHEQWVTWAENIMETERGLTPERKMRWLGLICKYKELSEEQKIQDRVWAKKVIEEIMRKVKNNEHIKKDPNY